MKTKRILAVVLSVMLMSAAIQAQSVDDVINSYVKAIGGMDKLKAIKTLKISMIFPQGAMQIPITMTFKRPDKVRTDVSFQGMSQITAFDGKIGWMINPFGGKTDAEKLPEEAVKGLKDQADFEGSMVDYKAKGYKAELLGKEDMEGTEVFKVRITKAVDDYETHYIDATSYLILKTVSKRKIKEKETESETIMSDYRDVGGVKMAYGIEQKELNAAEGQKMNIDKIEANVAVDDAMFVMPAPKPAAPASEPKK